MPIREVQGVQIVAWHQPEAVRGAPVELRAVFESTPSVERLLLDLSACDDLDPAGMEALTEAFRICADRKARVGMFGLTDETIQLIEVLGIQGTLPPVMGGTEGEALAALTTNGSAPAPRELTLEIPKASNPAVELEFDLDQAPATKPAGDVELEFDLDVGTAPTARFDASAVAKRVSEDVGLTAVLWGDLASQGYVIGGEGAEEIMDAIASGPASAPADDAGTIDLGDLEPATGPATKPDTGWSAAPAATGGIDFGAPPVAPPTGAGPTNVGLFGTPQPAAAGLFGGQGAPAPAFGDAFGGAAMVSSSLFAGPGGEAFSPVDPGTAGPPPAAVQAAAAAPAPIPSAAPEDSNETIMFAPGALDRALAEAAAKAAAENQAAPDPTPAAPPPSPVQAAPPPIEDEDDDPDGFYSSDNETVMIQPGMLDQALLAEVMKAAGEETPIAEPPVATPQVAPPPETNLMPTGDELEVRLFVFDQGIKSDLHVEVLGQLAKLDDKVVGPADLQLQGDLQSILDQFAQTRLVRRQRSPRVRGGSGFVLSGSPKARGTVTRMLRMWSDPTGRQKLSAWIREG